MTEEEYLRMKNILNAIMEQQAIFEENHRKAEARMTNVEIRMGKNAEAIASLLILAQLHDQEITKTNEQMNSRFQQIAATFEDIGKKSAETDERINALVNVVERYISKN
jgi:predicted ArsR family transcriptional regulator